MIFVLLCPAYQLSLKLYEIYVVQDVSIIIYSTLSVKPVLRECVLGVKNVERDSRLSSSGTGGVNSDLAWAIRWLDH